MARCSAGISLSFLVRTSFGAGASIQRTPSDEREEVSLEGSTFSGRTQDRVNSRDTLVSGPDSSCLACTVRFLSTVFTVISSGLNRLQSNFKFSFLFPETSSTQGLSTCSTSCNPQCAMSKGSRPASHGLSLNISLRSLCISFSKSSKLF